MLMSSSKREIDWKNMHRNFLSLNQKISSVELKVWSFAKFLVHLVLLVCCVDILNMYIIILNPDTMFWYVFGSTELWSWCTCETKRKKTDATNSGLISVWTQFVSFYSVGIVACETFNSFKFNSCFTVIVQ